MTTYTCYWYFRSEDTNLDHQILARPPAFARSWVSSPWSSPTSTAAPAPVSLHSAAGPAMQPPGPRRCRAKTENDREREREALAKEREGEREGERETPLDKERAEQRPVYQVDDC